MTDMNSFELSEVSFRHQNHALVGQHHEEEEDMNGVEPVRIQTSDNYFNPKLFYLIIPVMIILFASVHEYSAKNDIHNSPFQKEVQIHSKIPRQMYKIPHDPKCSTQGLAFINETHLFQTCGMHSQSFFHILQAIQNEKTLQLSLNETYRSDIFNSTYFLQGGCYFPKTKKYYILTYKQHIALVYNQQLVFQTQYKWQREGWGMTHNNSHLIISDGSSFLFITDQNLTILQTINVTTKDNKTVTNLNELQWIEQEGKQYILSNIFTTSTIVKIDLSTGIIAEQYDYTSLTIDNKDFYHEHVLNGIAYHPSTKEYLLTGKKWKHIYVQRKLHSN